MAVLHAVSINVTTADAELRFGIDESYSLTVVVGDDGSASAAISAPTAFGGLWALETLAQLTHRVWTTDENGRLNNSYYRVCAATVVDAPRFPFRSLLIDTSRHFMTITMLKQVVDLMAGVKMNALHLHLTDDQSWPVYIPDLLPPFPAAAAPLSHTARRATRRCCRTGRTFTRGACTTASRTAGTGPSRARPLRASCR